MSEEFEGNTLSQEYEDKSGKVVKSVEVISNKAKIVLWRYSKSKSMGEKIKFTPEELRTITHSWKYLEPKIQNLALIVYPEIAATLLNIELENMNLKKQ